MLNEVPAHRSPARSAKIKSQTTPPQRELCRSATLLKRKVISTRRATAQSMSPHSTPWPPHHPLAQARALVTRPDGWVSMLDWPSVEVYVTGGEVFKLKNDESCGDVSRDYISAEVCGSDETVGGAGWKYARGAMFKRRLFNMLLRWKSGHSNRSDQYTQAIHKLLKNMNMPQPFWPFNVTGDNGFPVIVQWWLPIHGRLVVGLVQLVVRYVAHGQDFFHVGEDVSRRQTWKRPAAKTLVAFWANWLVGNARVDACQNSKQLNNSFH